MGIFKTTKKVAGRVVDVRVDKWISWDYITETTGRFKSMLTDIIVPQKATYSETFEEAKQRLELTDQDIADRTKEFTRLFYFFLLLASLVFLYAFYLAFKADLFAAIIAFCLSLYALAQAFRFHFWLFQLKQKKLGCSFREWLDSSNTNTQNKEQLPTSKTKVKR